MSSAVSGPALSWISRSMRVSAFTHRQLIWSLWCTSRSIKKQPFSKTPNLNFSDLESPLWMERALLLAVLNKPFINPVDWYEKGFVFAAHIIDGLGTINRWTTYDNQVKSSVWQKVLCSCQISNKSLTRNLNNWDSLQLSIKPQDPKQQTWWLESSLLVTGIPVVTFHWSRFG